MPELYRESMQTVPFQRCNLWRCTSVTLGSWRSIESAARHRVANRREMYPDLVRPSCLNLHFQQGKLPVRAFNLLGYLPVRDGIPSRPALRPAPRSHARATNHVTADCRIDGSFRHFGPAVDQRDICLFDFAMSKLFCQLSMSQIRFRNYHQAAGFFVQTMDDSRPQLTADL